MYLNMPRPWERTDGCVPIAGRNPGNAFRSVPYPSFIIRDCFPETVFHRSWTNEAWEFRRGSRQVPLTRCTANRINSSPGLPEDRRMSSELCFRIISSRGLARRRQPTTNTDIWHSLGLPPISREESAFQTLHCPRTGSRISQNRDSRSQSEFLLPGSELAHTVAVSTGLQRPERRPNFLVAPGLLSRAAASSRRTVRRYDV